MYRIFTFIIIGFAIVLFLFSLITFLIIQWDLFNLNFEFTPQGVNNYLSLFSQYSSLFAGTITLIVAYFGIKRFEAAEQANQDKIKFDRYNDWKIVTDLRIDEFEEQNKRFRKEFYKIRYKLFLDIFDNDITIKNKQKLELIHNKYFKDRISFFEDMNEKSILMGNIYKDNTYTYFYDSLYYIFIGSLDEMYDNLDEDFKELYLSCLKPDRLIQKDMFIKAYKRYTGDI